jgi:hypothetical protein
MKGSVPTVFAQTSIAQGEKIGQLHDEVATGRAGAMVSFEVDAISFARQLGDFFNDLDLDDTDDEEDTDIESGELDRGYARIESCLVRKHVASGALIRTRRSVANANEASYHFRSKLIGGLRTVTANR